MPSFEELHRALKADKVPNLPSEKEFVSTMQAPGKQGYENRYALWNALKADGAPVGNTYGEFKKIMGLHATEKQQSTPSVYQKAQGGGGLGRGMRNVSANVRQSRAVGQPQAKVQQEPQNYIARPDSYTSPGSLVGQLEKRDKQAETAMMQPVRDISKKVEDRSFTPQRAGTQYVDEEGNVVKDETYDVYPLMPQEVAEDLDNRAAYEAMTNRWDAEKEIDEDLRDIRSEEEKLTARRKAAEGGKDPSEKTWWDYFRENFGASAVGAVTPMGVGVDGDMVAAEMTRKGAYGKERQDIMKDMDTLIVRKRLAEDAKQIIADAKKDKDGYSVLGGLTRAGEKVFETARDIDTWDFGATDMATQMAVAEAVIKADSGLGMTENEKKLLDTWAKNAAVNSEFGDQISGWTKAGMVTGESLPFMLEMAMNPASGLGQAATKQLLKYSLKKYGPKWVKDHAKSMLAGKIATRVVGDVVGAGVMASTSGAARVAADYERRMTGQVEIATDDKGNIIYNGVKQDTKDNPAAALFKAFASTSIENWSEMAGNYLGFLNSFFGKALGKAAIGKAGRRALQATGSVEGVSLNKAQKFIYELAAEKGIGAFSNGLKQFADRTQWHGVMNEYLEEVMGNIANAAVVGDMTFDTAKDTGVFNLEQNIDTFCGVALMGGFMSTLNTAGYAAHRYNYDVDRVNEENAKLFGDELWEGVKTMIDNSYTDPRELNDALTYILRGESGKKYSAEEKKAVLKYTQAVLEKEGAEMAQYQPRMDSSTVEEVTTPEGKKYVVTSLDKNGESIEQRDFDNEEEAKAYEGELKMNQQHRDYNDYLSMVNKLSYPEASDAVDEFMGTLGIDENGEDYADTVAAINDPKSDLGKQFRQFKLDKVMQKAEASRAAIESFEEENGWTPGTVAWLAEQDPMQMDSETLSMADDARAFLEGLAYPAGEVHVEHEQEKGSEAGQSVVENVISTEEPIDPNHNIGKDIQDQWTAAQAARQQMFDNDKTGDIQSQVESLEKSGFSPQEIISQLETFSPEQRQVMVDYYNAQARYQSMIDTAAKQIDNAARRSRNNHTFKGTINGQADVQNVHKITDGVNEYYLVSGNVTTDSSGRITGSTSGLIIGMDLDGSFVQLNDGDGYSVMPVDQTLDQYEEAERIRLQQQVTSVIDPEGRLRPTPAPSEEGKQQGAQPAVEAGQEQTGADEAAGETPAEQPIPAPQEGGTALDRIPKDEKGSPLYEQASAEDTYDALLEQVGNKDTARVLVQNQINQAKDRLKKLQKKMEKGDFEGNSFQEQIESSKKLQQSIDEEEGRIKYWTSVLTVPQKRMLKSEPAAPAETAETETPAAETPSGEVPEWRYDTPEAARERGYKIIEGNRVDRQEEKDMPKGMEVEVQYSTKDKVKGRLTVSELGDVQGSHLTNGQRNERHFLPEAQPKAEFGADRQAAAQTNASEENFRPELTLTFNGTQSAYSGSASQTNRRGEVIQGNGRRNLAEYVYAPGNEAVAKKYKEFLMAHAEELGTTAEEIAKMEKPFAHIVLDVSDEEAIRLGQFTAQDLESGGKKVPEVSTVTTKLGDKYSTLANIILKHDDPDASLADRIDANAEEAVKWLNNGGFINNTEAKTLLEDKALCRQFIKDLITDQLFKDAHPDLRTMFYELPKNIQSAIISVVGREVAIENGKSILKDIQESIRAYHELTVSSPEFANATGSNFEKRYAVVTAAVNDWLRQINIDGTVNSEKFSNFALGLAKLYKSLKDQKTLAGRLRDYYDLASGTPRELGIFDAPASAAPMSKEEIIKQIFGIEYGRQRTVPVAGNNQSSEEGREGSADSTESGESEQEGAGQADNRGGDTVDGEVEAPPQPSPKGEGALSREEYLASHPLTEEQIMADTEANEDEKLNAIDFLRGEDDSAISRFYYDGIYNRSNRSVQNNADTSGTSADPLQAMEKAAKSFREEQKSKDQQDIDDALKEFNDFLDNAKGSNVLDAFMRKGLEGNDKLQASLLDAFTLTNEAQRMFLKDLLRLASKIGYAYLKKGVHDAQAWSRQMTDSIGKKLNETLGWDDAIVGEFVDEVWNQKYTVDGQRMRMSEHAERLKNDKGADTAVNVNKNENNVTENVVSSQQEAAKPQLEGDSAEYAERQAKIKNLSDEIAKTLRKSSSINGTRLTFQYYKALAKTEGIDNLSDTDLQELIEAEIVNLAREIANGTEESEEQKYQHIVRLYENQPSLNVRDNDRVNLQQYSTPAPMAFLMGTFCRSGRSNQSGLRGLEPSAGNGMLTIGLPKEGMHVNDIDEMRLSNLQKQGFGEVTSQDGTLPFGDKQYDVIVTNPPFGNVTPKVYDGIYEISGLEHQMAINALESMKDDGRAAIIIGGNTEYNTNGTIKGKDRVFLNYLYAHYNVVDVINMDGKTLYSRQGTGIPVRMILINGRKEYNPKDFAPVQSKARAEQVKSYDELYKRVNDDILLNENKSAGVHDTESGESGRVDDSSNAGNAPQTGVRNGGTKVRSGEHQSSDGGRQHLPGSTVSTEEGTDTKGDSVVGGTNAVAHGGRENTSQPSGTTSSQTDGGREGTAERGNSSEQPSGVNVSAGRPSSVEQPEQKRELGAEKVPYRKQSSNPFDLQSQMPAEQADVVKKALESIGDVDQFLVDELGYSSKEELYQALAAEQIDSVALAIHQMKNGDAFIIGDQTGIGKGRQGAALIRWAVKNGKAPVYFTAKPELFSSVYRDIKDIGSNGLRPFILASDKVKARITERNKKGEDEVIYDLPSDKEQKRVLEYINKNGKLPPEYDFMITTYSQVGNGTMEYENGNKKARSYGRGKTATKADINGQGKRDAIEKLAGNSIVLMDESHLAGGASARGNYLQYISTKANGITYISATFAKRPDNMPLYSLRTAISKAGVEIGALIDAVKRGGATFQEIMSKALTEAGQMIRRERDMRGVTVDWKGIEDEDVIQKHYEQYDKIIGLFNDIISFQRTYVDPIVNKMNDDAADAQGAVDHTPGTRDMGINNTPFASQTHNIVKQVLLSLKAEEGAKFAVECLKNGEKPVICVENTNEGAAERAVGNSGEEDMVMPDLSTNLMKGLEGTMRIQNTDAFGNRTQSVIPFGSLSEEGQRRYREIEKAIENASTGLSLSPIDVIKNHIRQAGFTVAELTGRKKEFVYNEDGTVRRVNRTDTDNKKNASDFNNGKVDAVIINKSAGTGIDLHAGIKFDNTNQRHMITIQAQSDINDEVQMRGRTDRTGQKQHSKYTYIVSTIPSEQRLLMMLKAKLRSLDANTTSSQKSKFNEMNVQDIINKYGDEIVIQYLAEHPETYVKLADPLKWGENVFDTPPEALVQSAEKPQGDGATASKVLGRMALLTVKEQEKMLDEIGELYQAEIDRLNEMGENDLEITEMPLRAKTLAKTVWEQGIDPGGKNPFADNTYVEKVTMDVLKKPMKGEEVKRAQAHLLGGKTWEEYKADTLAKVDKWAEDKKKEATETITARAEKKAKAEQERYVKAAKKAQEKNGLSDAEIERNGEIQYKNIYQQEIDKLDDSLKAIEKQKQVFVDALELFNTDKVYAIPSNIYDLGGITFEPGMGKLIDIKISDNFSTNASTLSFATLDGRRKITIPVSGMVKQQNDEKRSVFPAIMSLTAQTKNGMFGSNVANTLKVLEQNIDNWDKLTSSAARKDGYIITGNLLKALVSTREQHVGGKLISYTTDTGEVRQGILMPDSFEPGNLTSKTPISAMKDELRYGRDEVTSADGDVRVRVSNDWDWISRGYNTLELIVPKSKKKGEKYFNDKELLSLMDGQFEGSSRMKAEFKRANLDAVMKRLDELGVTVNEERKDNTSDTGRRYDEDIDEGSDTSKLISDTRKKYGLYGGGAITQVIDSREQLEKLRGHVPNYVYRDIEDAYDKPGVTGIHLSHLNIIVIFSEKMEDANEGLRTWFHEETHDFWYGLPPSVRDEYGKACLSCLRQHFPEEYDYATNYGPARMYNEACSFFAEAIVKHYGVDAFLTADLAGNENLCNFVTELRKYLKNGKQKTNQSTDNRLRQLPERERSNGRPSSHGRNEAVRGRERVAPLQARIAEHIDKLVENLGTKERTTVYHSFDELPEADKEYIRSRERQGRKVRGWYHNGHIYLYLPHIDSKYQAEKTLWHETVAHHGLRNLIGDKNMDALLSRLWMEHKDGDMGKWVADRMQMNGWSLNEAIEEYLAREAEKHPFEQPSLWQRLRWMLADALHKIGFATDPTISDIQYLFWVSQNRLREGDALSVAKQQAFLHRLERAASTTPHRGQEDDGRRNDESAPIFVSNALDAVAGIKQEKATPEQWLKMIEKNGGLKAGEDKWMGLSEWLKGQDKKSLTKQEVLDFIRENQIRVEEVNYSSRRTFNDNGEVESDAPINKTRLEYTTRGLDNKKEIALTVPTIESWNESDKVHFGDAGKGRAVAWIRFGETTDADGNRVLVIDEIQSKRHQEGREKGYKTKQDEQEIKDLDRKRKEAWDALIEYEAKLNRKYGNYINATEEEKNELSRLRDEWQNMFVEVRAKGEIPDAPFDKNWHELAMKRMLRYAAEHGYDKIAWTKGDQQAERYDIGNAVEKIISYDFPKDGTKKIEIRMKDGETMPLVVDSEGQIVDGRSETIGKTLSDVVGKDLSRRIMEGEGKDATIFDDNQDLPAKTIEGEGLRIGGEGMKGFYDQMLPRFMDKYGKRWGAKTGEIVLSRLGDNGITMWSVDVTPSMKSSVMEGQRMFDEDIEEPLERSAKAVYEDRLNRVETVFSEAYQDAMVSLKTAQNAIAKDKEIPDSQNAYMAENLMHGKNKNEQDLYNIEYRDPLIETINKIMTTTGMNWGDVDRYVYTKSGLERNREFFVRDWLEAERSRTIRKYEDLNEEEQDIYDEKAKVIEEQFEDGDIDEAEKNKRLRLALQEAHNEYLDDIESGWHRTKARAAQIGVDDYTFADYLSDLTHYIEANIDESYDPSEHDYSGFRAMFGDAEGKYDEAAIIDELMDTEDQINSDDAADDVPTVDVLWTRIRRATRYGLERYREAGMRSDEQIDEIESMFHFYVPMRGFKEDKGEDMYQYFTGKGRTKSYVGGLLKHAKGRGSEAEYPISTIFAMTYKAIADCNQNMVNQKLYRLCQANPNDLIVLSDSWAVLNTETGQWEESGPDIPADATEDEVRNITLAWEDEMRRLSLEGKAKKITGRPRFDYVPLDKEKKSEHEIDVRINGKPRKMFVVGNPRMAQALNGQLRFEKGRNVFSKLNAAIKNFMASLFTSYSPTFALRNMMRDWTHFRTMLGVREGEGYARQANKYYRQSLFKMVGLFKKYRADELDMSKEIERDFKDFMDNGGITGFVQMLKIDDIQKQMEKLYKQQKEGKPIRLNNAVWDYTLGAIEALNEGIENNARFATFRASRHYAGRTKARSAYDAKEITVNFNRKGAGGKTAGFKSDKRVVEDTAKLFGISSQILGEGRIFFNATVQAIATTFKNFQNPDGSLNKKYIAKWAAKYALPPFMFGLALPMINKMLAAALDGGDGDDDPYANLPEWTRRKNICIYAGNNNFITIPIGQELAAFLTLGDIFAGNTYAPELKPVDRDLGDEMVDVMNTFSPVDISTKITKGGMMEDPISEVTGRTFSVLAPLVAVEQNLSWTGRPIYREDKFKNDKYVPEYQMVYSSTNPVMVSASQKLHELGGGNDRARGKEWSEVNPAIIQYLWEQYTGGPGKVFSNTISIGKDVKDYVSGKGSDFNIRKVEGIKAFFQQGDDRTQYYRAQSKFYKYQEDADKFKYDHDVSGLEKQAKTDPAAKLELDSLMKTPEYQRYAIIKEVNRSSKKEGKVGLDELRKEIYRIADRKEKRAKMQTYNHLMKEVVDLLDQVGKE